MNPTRTLRRLALTTGLAALGTALPAAAQAGVTVEKSVPINISVTGAQHTDWHTKSELQDSCSNGTIIYQKTGAEDLGFHTRGKVAATLSTVHDDDTAETYSRIDLDPPDPRGAFLGLEANTHRDSATTQTQIGGHEAGCGGSDEDPEPPLGPDCGSQDHTLWVRLLLDRSGDLKVSNTGIINNDPFKRCSTPAQLSSPRLAEVQDDTTTTVTGQGDSRVATVVGRRVVHQPLPGGEAVTTLRWRVVLERFSPDEVDEELGAAAEPASAQPAAAAPAAPAVAPRPYSRPRWATARKQATSRRHHARRRR